MKIKSLTTEIQNKFQVLFKIDQEVQSELSNKQSIKTTDTISKQTFNPNQFIRNNSISNNSKEIISIPIEFGDSIKKKIEVNSTFNRLYNYDNTYKLKNEQKSKEQLNQITKRANPKISPVSMSIIREKNDFPLRLHDLAIDRNTENIEKDSFTKFYQKNVESTKIENKFSHSPEISKKSRELAKKQGSSSNRILSKKSSRSRNKENEIKTTSIGSKSTNRGINYSSVEMSNNLYERGLQSKRIKEEIANKCFIIKQEEYKNYPFKPKISDFANSLDSKSLRTNLSTYEKNIIWKSQIEQRNSKSREKQENDIQRNFKFIPNISKQNSLNADESFISKVAEQMNEYVKNRRNQIKAKEDYEEYKKAKLGVALKRKRFERITVPKEFSFISYKSKSPSKMVEYRERARMHNFTSNSKSNKSFEGLMSCLHSQLLEDN